MRFAAYALLFTFTGLASLAATPKSSSTKRPPVRKGLSSPTSSTPKRRGKRISAAPHPTVQQSPSPERYKEIQQALASKGYLKSEPTGIWDQQSADALREFQTDTNLAPTGKLSSATLIGLGLGGSTGQKTPAAVPSAVTVSPPSEPQ